MSNKEKNGTGLASSKSLKIDGFGEQDKKKPQNKFFGFFAVATTGIPSFALASRKARILCLDKQFWR